MSGGLRLFSCGQRCCVFKFDLLRQSGVPPQGPTGGPAVSTHLRARQSTGGLPPFAIQWGSLSLPPPGSRQPAARLPCSIGLVERGHLVLRHLRSS